MAAALVLAAVAFAAGACSRGDEVEPIDSATQGAVGPTPGSNPQQATEVPTATSVGDMVWSALVAGESVPVLVHADAPDSTDCRELLPYMVAGSTEVVGGMERVACTTNPV